MEHSPQDPTRQDQDPKRMILLSCTDVAACMYPATRAKEVIISHLPSLISR